MLVKWADADSSKFRTVNVSLMLRHLMTQDRVTYHKDSETYIWRNCSFKWESNTSSRLFPEIQLSQSVAFISCISGKPKDLTVLFEKFKFAANQSSTTFIILPVKQNTQPAKASLNTEILPTIQKCFPDSFSRENLETNWKSTVKFFCFIPSTSPMSAKFSDYLQE